MTSGSLPPAEALQTGSPRRRRRWPWIVLAVVVVVLVGAAVIAENVARAATLESARSQVVSGLGLADDADVSVSVGDGLVLPQLIRGRLDRLSISAPGVDFGGFRGDLSATAEGVPVRSGGAVTSISARFRVPEAEARRLANAFTGIQLDDVSFAPPEVEVTSSVKVLGFTVPVRVGLTPSVDSGSIVLTPTTVKVSGTTLNTSALSNGPFASVAKPFLAPRSVCVADKLPKGLRLRTIAVSKTDITLGLDGAAIALDGKAKGSCR